VSLAVAAKKLKRIIRGLNTSGGLICSKQEAISYQKIESIKKQIIPFGFDDDIFRITLKRKLKSSFNIIDESSRSLFLCAGTGNILKTLYETFANIKFKIVQIGNQFDLDQKYKDRVEIVATVTRRDSTIPAALQPPVPSNKQMDRYVWQYVLKLGESNDYFFFEFYSLLILTPEVFCLKNTYFPRCCGVSAVLSSEHILFAQEKDLSQVACDAVTAK